MLSRHGIRNPNKKDILNGHAMISEMKYRGASPSIVDHLQSVMESFPLSEAALLAETGAEEQRELGRHTSHRFASVFRKRDHLTFVSSTSPRAISSKKNFELGFNEGLGWNASSSYQQRDDLLRFFDNCPRYIDKVRKNRTAFAEFDKFRDNIFPQVVQYLAKRLSANSLNMSNGKFYLTCVCECKCNVNC